MAYKVFDKLVLVHFFLVLSSGAPAQKEIVIKSIKSENGDIFDCINIMSQPTFQDPAFMNHTIQMIPSSYPNFINEKSQEKTTISHAEINTVPCPSGTIPVLRNHRINNTRQRNINTRVGMFSDKFPGYYLASVGRKGRNFGTSASTSVYEPYVVVGKEERYSGSAAFISNGTSDTDFMEAGWIVSPKDFGDNKVRFYTYWGNRQNEDCMNLLCPGFVQVSSDIPLGAQLQPVSVYGGAQHFITVHIFKDFKTGNWWLAFGKNKKLVGYWIKSTFNHMDNGASRLSWGGDAEGPRYERSPPIGSGHFAYEGFGKAAVFMDATIIDENNNHFVPNPDDFYRQVDRTVYPCYGLDNLGSGPNGIGFYFGGPGGCIDN